MREELAAGSCSAVVAFCRGIAEISGVFSAPEAVAPETEGEFSVPCCRWYTSEKARSTVAVGAGVLVGIGAGAGREAGCWRGEGLRAICSPDPGKGSPGLGAGGATKGGGDGAGGGGVRVGEGGVSATLG